MCQTIRISAVVVLVLGAVGCGGAEDVGVIPLVNSANKADGQQAQYVTLSSKQPRARFSFQCNEWFGGCDYKIGAQINQPTVTQAVVDDLTAVNLRYVVSDYPVTPESELSTASMTVHVPQEYDHTSNNLLKLSGPDLGGKYQITKTEKWSGSAAANNAAIMIELRRLDYPSDIPDEIEYLVTAAWW